MSYFKDFPVMSMRVPGTEDSQIMVRDITRRVAVRSSVKESETMFLAHRVRDGETPEIISNAVYGTPGYHWTILVLNNIHDIRNDWCQPQTRIRSIARRVYPSACLFIEGMTDKAVPGAIVQGEDGGFSIKSTDTQFSRVVIENAYGSISSDEELTDTNGNLIGYARRLDAYNIHSIHHFEDSNGNWLDPREDIGGGTTRIQRYMGEGDQRNLDVVTNLQHLERQNDLKRNIKLIKPQYIQELATELHAALRTHRRTR